MNGVDAHHLVVDVALKTIQTPESRRLRPVACQTTERHSRAVQLPLHGLHLHLHHVVGVDERLLPHPFKLPCGTEGLTAVEVFDLDVWMVNAVLAQKHGHSGMRRIQRIV